MSRRVKKKWRPELSLVLGGALLAVSAIPVIGLTWFRMAGNILSWSEAALLILTLALVVCLVLALLLQRLVLSPVKTLTTHAQAVKAGQTDATPPLQFGTEELSQLGDSVIAMGDALQARAQSLSAYAMHVTHELKSPLTSLRASAEMLRSGDLAQEDRERLLQGIENSVSRMTLLLEDLRAQTAARVTARPGHTRVSDALAASEIPPGLNMKITADRMLPMSAADLGNVLTQMTQNAQAHGAKTVFLEGTETGLIIGDNGTGIAAGDRDRVLDPFFTTRRDTGGTGMGLAIARMLVEAAGGQLSVLHREDGAWFRIAF